MSDPYGQPPYGQQPYGQQPQRHGLTPDELTWGGAAHWSALVAAFAAMAFLGPLVVLLAKGNDSAYVRAQASESLNFQLSMLIYGAVGAVLALIVALATFGFALVIVIPLALAFACYWLIFTIIGSVKSVNGDVYRYPLTIRLVS